MTTLPVIAIVACNHFSAFHFSVPCIVFDNILPEKRLFELKIYASEEGTLTASHGINLNAQYNLAELSQADIIIIPYWHNINEKPNQPLLDCLIHAYDRGSQLVGLCLGAYVLAYTGLLDQHRATTHWQFAQDFTHRFPHVLLDPNALYICDDRLITSAGTAAGLDCCLYLVRQLYGSAIANKIAKKMVLSPHRKGGQAQFIERAIPNANKDQRIQQLLQYLRQNIQQHYTLDHLAQYSLMSRRTLTRQFQLATGMSIGEWLIVERLQRCQELLELTNLSIESIAEQVGFSSAKTLRQYFKLNFFVTPSQWRKNFHVDL